MKLVRPPIPPKKRAVRARAWRKGGVGGSIAVQNPTNPLKTLTRIKIGGAESGS